MHTQLYFEHFIIEEVASQVKVVLMATTSTVISERTSYSRKSATYTASTFTAFESYGSTYEYHGLYNTKSEESDDSEESESRGFDGWSFIGGIFCSVSIMAICYLMYVRFFSPYQFARSTYNDF